MLDIKFIRENKELIAEAARKKHIAFKVDELITADDERRAVLKIVEDKRAEQNRKSEQITRAHDDNKRQAFVEEMRALKVGLQEEEERLKKTTQKWQSLMLLVPNVPDISVPEGVGEEDNKEMRTWGEKPEFTFEPKSHIELMKALDMADFERGAAVSGFRGYFLKNDGALLSLALWRLCMDFFTKKDFSPILAPSLVRRESLLGTGYLPQGEDDLYKTQDGDYLAGTAEVPVMSYFADTILSEEELPKKIIAFSPCFRREAGSHGKDTKGLMRVHEFFKCEQVVLCEASHQASVALHEEINRNEEEFMETLGIPYRTVINCGADLGLGQVKKYDIELWVPSEKRYREISSASYFHDFQTRRLNIRYKNKDDKAQFAHSLNCTAAPTPRLLISILENNQRADGSIAVPKVLVPYFGKEEIR
ncbi:MAG: serine--tRNA ligase [Candidatus Taylorbacteria bacterium RIFCSPHIGHO2_02_FULL_47_18]|uniref:Serine--tRNA ligase n=1 Tax=Candidatus Taylorbacteria bacterium RIFCSPLOWO2_01_FULL_48_100 TaxID=1802322 RepID=A0A1G2NEC8_9BACT|nr:MAG: serine--tRNA ligase [Candidatus Taylorbacteria bacterium RIFCSPHIGHO2_01_FULL_48_38]OHA28411.1 MAG: serine--tRNA ligase [Candidatus Taylorbacteria bacterium RIFCSPHIGHO2_02_FULL_47_18]OHA34406.1 MAG: serine--tRNA ligase [Candidatus Taylorbacteria bacterium RIFCSPLOWO2_01_FULL_48_100]OHA40166.1 MAG: serine--tRNA ligase [Candidatus Taylorbacteria bacterium RIFCSPLOWO2_02_FULL_48_16]OHA45499.1 MAG: serine--tRNA ligase [Candidatus Taylorbacteria bacterium RIFCSPLOWO2_12_FULL_48_11]